MKLFRKKKSRNSTCAYCGKRIGKYFEQKLILVSIVISSIKMFEYMLDYITNKELTKVRPVGLDQNEFLVHRKCIKLSNDLADAYNNAHKTLDIKPKLV